MTIPFDKLKHLIGLLNDNLGTRIAVDHDETRKELTLTHRSVSIVINEELKIVGAMGNGPTGSQN